MLQTLNHHHGPPLDSLQYVNVLSVLGSTELDAAIQLCLSSTDQRGRLSILDLRVMLSLTQSRVPIYKVCVPSSDLFLQEQKRPSISLREHHPRKEKT